MRLVQIENIGKHSRAVVLNRPDKLNALSGDLIAELMTVLVQLHKETLTHQVRAIVFKSTSPKAFCVGADLGERMGMNETQVSETLLKQRALMDAVAALPVPTFACIEGAAFGGGLELALACDFRFCSPHALVGLTETKLAIIPGAGGTQRLTRLVGMARAKEMIFTAQRLSGDEALAAGVVSGCSLNPGADILKRIEAIEAAGPVAVVAAKKAIEGAASLELSAALDFERSCYEMVLHTQDRIEGLKAFTEKRSPNYQGK